MLDLSSRSLASRRVAMHGAPSMQRPLMISSNGRPVKHLSSLRYELTWAALHPPALARAMATARAIRASPQKDVS
eukprot:CAMPEP_0113287308 /NCGR_PEP_ID=MMETSP0008_2-20120614/31637_1 /TAXON_ID=97485 /ORGANISM="Prymnesium parvum" /LENGTH=74 /DNA_ID=CAMNT_0000138527 /DNA_START=131 /DNA_END=355 /DNA_ORIENTATION=+ /assembly_acc=CAM_ASM_000153